MTMTPEEKLASVSQAQPPKHLALAQEHAVMFGFCLSLEKHLKAGCPNKNGEGDALRKLLKEIVSAVSVDPALLAIDRMQERVRAEGQAEGFAAAVQQLRDMRGQKPQPAFARVAEMLALRLEQSRIPCAAIRETPHAEG